MLVKPIALLSEAFLAVFFLIIWISSSKKYSSYIKALPAKEFKLAKLMPVGLYLLDRYRYSFNTGYDHNLKGKLAEVYGQDYAVFYLHIFHSDKITIIFMFLASELLLAIFKGLNLTLLIYTMVIFGILLFIDDYQLSKKVKKRRLEIQLKFPEFINKLTLLLNAGLTMSKAWEKISNDNRNKGDFYNEVTKTVAEMHSGKNEADAYSNFAKRLKSPEISRLISTIIQNTKRGGNDLVITLRLQSTECWEMRKNAVKKLGEEASTKLLFPMIIMFLAIILIVVLPAILSMKGIINDF